jgi:hypothetical protein
MPRTEAQKLKRKAKKKLKKLESKASSSASAPATHHKKKASKPATHALKVAKPVKLSGSGDYKAGSKTGGKWARTAGLAGDFIDSIFGTGDYSINYNTIMDANGPPQFENAPMRGTRVRHREYIADVVPTTSSFSIKEYLVSATNSQTFPWLSAMASNFEQYRVHGMVFEFKPLASESSANVGLGYIGLAFQYDVADQPFKSKLEFDNYEFAISNSPTVPSLLGVECAKNQVSAPLMYVDSAVRAGYTPDVRMNQMGRFVLATGGQSVSTGVIGEIWASYDVEFLKPKIGYPVSVQHVACLTSSNISGGYAWNTTLYPYGPFNLGGSNTVFDCASIYQSSPTIFTFSDVRLSGRGAFLEYVMASATSIPAVPSVSAVLNTTVSSIPDLQVISGTFVRVSYGVTFTNGSGPWAVNFGMANATVPASGNSAYVRMTLTI